MDQGGAGRQGEPGAPPAAAARPSLPAAGAGLFASAAHLAVAVAALLAAEVRLVKQHIGLAFLGGVALVAFAVALWGCLVALIGWAFRVATGSTGIALGLLVVLHLVLVAACWFAIKRGLHQASFPKTRAELAALRQGLRRGAAESPASATASARANRPAP